MYKFIYLHINFIVLFNYLVSFYFSCWEGGGVKLLLIHILAIIIDLFKRYNCGSNFFFFSIGGPTKVKDNTPNMSC